MTTIEETREQKSKRLERHLRLGNAITARLAEKLFGISGTGFHRQLGRYKQAGMILQDEWVEYDNARFKRYFIDDSQNARLMAKSRKYTPNANNLL